MMGRLKSDPGQLFYEFHLGDAVPEDHLVRKIDAALDLSWLRSELAPHYSSMGRPSIDPELMIRMLVVGYVFALRSERLICREVQVNLAYRWFCKLGIEDALPDHSAFSRARNERFREGDVFRRVFERVVETCIAAGLVGGEGFAVDASLIQADASGRASPTFAIFSDGTSPRRVTHSLFMLPSNTMTPNRIALAGLTGFARHGGAIDRRGHHRTAAAQNADGPRCGLHALDGGNANIEPVISEAANV
jgi:transposase